MNICFEWFFHTFLKLSRVLRVSIALLTKPDLYCTALNKNESHSTTPPTRSRSYKVGSLLKNKCLNDIGVGIVHLYYVQY